MFGIKNLLERLRGKKRSHKELLRAYDRAAKPSPPRVIEPVAPPQEEISVGFVLDIQNAFDMEKYLSVLNNLRGFENFSELSWLRVRLDRIRKALSGISAPEDFDGEFNFKLACKVRGVAEIMLDVFRYAKTSTNLEEGSRRQLCAMAEDYLEKIGVTKKLFSVGDAFDDWADLNMQNSYEVISTNDRALNGKIAAIEIQPHMIFYRSDFGDVEHLIFGGICRVYKFKED